MTPVSWQHVQAYVYISSNASPSEFHWTKDTNERHIKLEEDRAS
jgi:hypothetical protein